MIESRQYVEGLGEVGTSVGNLVTNVRDLGKLISMRDEAYARIQTAGADNIGKIAGTRVSMVVSYLKEDYPVLQKIGKFPLRLAKSLVKANSQGKYYSTRTSKAYDKARKTADEEGKLGIEPAERTAIVCPSRTNFSMSPDENAQHYVFVFEDMAHEDEESERKSYFQLNNGPIVFYPVSASTIDGENPRPLTAKNGSTQNFLWFSLLDNRSKLVGYDWRADSNIYWSRGVLNKST